MSENKVMTDKELFECAKALKDHCDMIHNNNPNYKGGWNCDYCIFAKKSVRYNKDSWSEPRCLLKDDFERSEPQFWQLGKVKIEEPQGQQSLF